MHDTHLRSRRLLAALALGLLSHAAQAKPQQPTAEAVLAWLAAAGLEAEVVEHLEGGELTVTIWLARQPASRLREVA